MSYNDPQPKPHKGSAEVSPRVRASLMYAANYGEFPHDLAQRVCDDLQERIDWGTAKYGTPLEADNGRDALIDYYQEQLDALHYVGQEAIERPSDTEVMYRANATMRLVLHTRAVLFARDNK
jgi:hypothetical protein